MGLLSKIWKGIKKTAKKITKGVKKVFGKIGKAFGKLGVVGQIGMMFLMPYAMGALSSFAGSALGTVGQWSSTLLSKAGVGSKAVRRFYMRHVGSACLRWRWGPRWAEALTCPEGTVPRVCLSLGTVPRVLRRPAPLRDHCSLSPPVSYQSRPAEAVATSAPWPSIK